MLRRKQLIVRENWKSLPRRHSPCGKVREEHCRQSECVMYKPMEGDVKMMSGVLTWATWQTVVPSPEI